MLECIPAIGGGFCFALFAWNSLCDFAGLCGMDLSGGDFEAGDVDEAVFGGGRFVGQDGDADRVGAGSEAGCFPVEGEAAAGAVLIDGRYDLAVDLDLRAAGIVEAVAEPAYAAPLE